MHFICPWLFLLSQMFSECLPWTGCKYCGPCMTKVFLCCYCHPGQNFIISFWKWGTLLLSSYYYYYYLMEVEECLESLNFMKWDETCDQNAKERVICTWFLKLMFLFGFRLFRIGLSQKCKVKVLYFLRCKSTFWNCLKLYMTQF